MKNTLLKRILAIVLLALFLSSIITGIAFLFVGRYVFARQKSQELYQSAQTLSALTSLYQQGRITFYEYDRLLSQDTTFWDAPVFVFDRQGSLVLYSKTLEEQQVLTAKNTLQKHVETVLSGNQLKDSAYGEGVGMIIGLPVLDAYGNITGAVFLTKPIEEINSAMNSLYMALLISLTGAFLLMLIPSYFAVKSIANPLKQMSNVALKMAEGDFSIRATDSGEDEVAQLGRSLNTMSMALSDTIHSLRLERDRMKSILNGMGEGILAMDAKGLLTHCNPSALSLLGATRDQDITRVNGFDAIIVAMQQALSKDEFHVLDHRVGSDTIRITISPFHSEPGSMAGVVALLQNVTESVKLERTRREYVANVSHELKTPIASIRGLAEALKDNMIKSEEDRTRYYGYILRECMRLSRLINDLLELSRLQSGAVAFEKQRVPLYELFDDTLLRYEAIAQESGLTLNSSNLDRSCVAFTNPDRAVQVLVILLDNAIKYSPDDATIFVGLEQKEQELHVFVENPGTLSTEQLSCVFDRFYKADASHSTEGTGLGLSIAREVLTLLGERIWAESKDGLVRFAFSLQMG